MKLLLTILFLFAVTVNAQTVKVSTSSNVSAPVVYTQAGTNNAIAAQAKAQAVIDARQDSAYKSLPTLDTNTIAKVRGGKVVFLQDPLVVTTMNQLDALRTGYTSQVVLLQSADNKLFSAIATLQAQTTAHQLQLNTQQALIDKLTVQVAALLAWQANMKIANQ